MLFVKSFDTHVVDAALCPTGADLKIFLANNDNLPLGDLQLYNGPVMIDDHDLLGDLAPDTCVDVVVPILGGAFLLALHHFCR